jgi:hypothetical protein
VIKELTTGALKDTRPKEKSLWKFGKMKDKGRQLTFSWLVPSKKLKGDLLEGWEVVEKE